MRTRRFANSERIRAKERRLLEVLRRQQAALTLSAMPSGVLGSLSYAAPIGSTTATIQAPLTMILPTAQESWVVDQDPVPDPTGGFDTVIIAPGKQIAELASSSVASFAGRPSGTYYVVARQTLVDENPETRNPPGKYAGGTGVYTEHETFFGHSQPLGAPIPREGYDDTLSPEVVSEAVDRMTIDISSGTPTGRDVALLQVSWSGSSIISASDVSAKVDFGVLLNHIGQGGAAHANATTSTAGFMSAADKTKLDQAAINTPGTIVIRDSGGHIKDSNFPVAQADLANKGYVDAMSGVVGAHNHDTRYVRFDINSQGLSSPQQINARANIDAAATNHTHDDRYYTETEVNNLLNGKLGTGATAANSNQLGGQGIGSFVRTDANSTVGSSRTTTFQGTVAVTGALRIPVK